MYREVIEHPESLPNSIKEHLDLNSGADRGRIYRIVPQNGAPRLPPALGNASTAELVALLDHPNGWHRDTAARLLHERQDKAAAPALVALARQSAAPATRILALQVLEGLRALDRPTLTRALADPSADVRAATVRLCALSAPDQSSAELVTPLASDPSPRVRGEVSWALVSYSPANKGAALLTLFTRADEPWLRRAAIAAAGKDLEPILAELATREPSRVAEFRQLLERKSAPAVKAPDFGPAAPRAEAVAHYQPALALHGDPAKGRATFEARCAICHRFAGKGNAVGPDLDTARLAGREKILGNILEPSREITAGFNLGIVETKSGETLAGILANESAAGVQLRLPGGSERLLQTSEISKLTRPQRSLMPDGIETGLTVQEMADLLEFLTTAPQ